MEMKKLVVRVNNLVARFNDNASSDNEKDACYQHACKFIEKQFNCPRWVSSTIFSILADKYMPFPKPEHEIHRPANARQIVERTLNLMGIKYQTIVTPRGGSSIQL